jgi:hypothetical protein
VASANKDVEKEKQEQSSSSKSNVEEEDAWTQLLIEYHKAILSTWDLLSIWEQIG